MASAAISPDDVYREALATVEQRLLDSRQLSAEYRAVQALDRRIDHATSVASAYASCNRYFNVLPYNYNQVQLCSGSTYINASHVRCSDRISSQDFAYIATQGPLPSTISDFWAMVLEHRVPFIVMLTNVVERGVTKCACYFPEREGMSIQCEEGLQVTATSLQKSQDAQMTVRVLRLTRPGSTPLTVQHYHYHAWPDHGTPEESHAIRRVCLALQRAREDVQAAGCAAASSNNGAPANEAAVASTRFPRPQAVVHCSAGIGRTGTFVAVDIVCQRLHKLAARARCGGLPGHALPKALSEALDLPTLVHELRQQRMGMVQTLEQYCFIYSALHEELEHALGGSSGSGNSGGGGGGAGSAGADARAPPR